MSWQPCATFFPGHILMLCHTGLGLCLDPQSHDKKFTQLNLHFSGRMSFLPIYQISNLVLLFFPQRQTTFSRPSLTETSLPTFSRHWQQTGRCFSFTDWPSVTSLNVELTPNYKNTWCDGYPRQRLRRKGLVLSYQSLAAAQHLTALCNYIIDWFLFSVLPDVSFSEIPVGRWSLLLHQFMVEINCLRKERIRNYVPLLWTEILGDIRSLL